MPFSLSGKSVFLLIFFLHGLIFASFLLSHGLRHGTASSRWLSLFLLLCSLYLAPFMCGYAGWYGREGYREALFYLPLQQVLLLGPVMYVYLRSLLQPAYRVRGRGWFHFIPAGAYGAYSLLVFGVDVLLLGEPWFYADGRDKDLDSWYQWAGLFSMMGYFGLSLWHYRRYRQLTEQVLSYAEEVSYRWVQRWLWAFVLLLLLRVLFFILNPEWGEFGSKFWYYVCFSLLFGYVAILGYTHAVRMEARPLRPAPNDLDDPEGLEPSSPAHPPATLPDLSTWQSRLETQMIEQRLYADPSLTLRDVATALDTTPKQVSGVVNQGFGLNFNDYVNRHRCQAVIAQFARGEHHRHTLLAIALDCGFNSKSTFNRAFKKHIGLTPQGYLKQKEEAECPPDGGQNKI